jgi:uncharacterized protein
MKIPNIEKLYYSPVKSLSFCDTSRLFISKNIGIKNDRIFAFTRIIKKSESIKYQNIPNERKLNFFLTLKNSPYLNKYNFYLDNKYLYFYLSNKLINKILLKNENQYQLFSDELMNREKSIKQKPYLIYNQNNPFFDTMPDNSISLINISSIKDFEKKINRKIEIERFRANFYIKDLNPWKEFNWLNKKISINNSVFKVVKKIPRCSATNLVPNLDISDINIPSKLKTVYGHINMGIYLVPLTDGIVKVGNNIDVY